MFKLRTMSRLFALSVILAFVCCTCVSANMIIYHQTNTDKYWIAYSTETNVINPSYDVRYGTSGYNVFSRATVGSDITYDTTVSYCETLGYVPLTDTAPAANGAILYGGSLLNKSQAFYMDVTADDGYFECTKDMLNYTTNSNYKNPCYYRYQHGIFDQYTYTTSAGNSLRGSAFFSGNYMNVKSSAGEDKALIDEVQALNGYLGYYWNYDSVIYPLGQLYLVGMQGTNEQVVCRMDMPPTQEADFAGRLGARVDGTSTFSSSYGQLNVVCVAQSVQITYTTAKPTQPVFVQGWKDLTWVQKHWYVPYVIIAAVLLIILLIILIVCCCKKNQEVENRIEASMVVRERVGKAYAYEDDNDDEDELQRSFHN